MKEIGSWDFINFQKKSEHQKLIDEFFIKNTKKERLVAIKIKDSPLNFKVGSGIGEMGISILGSNEKDYNFYDEYIIKEDFIKRLHFIINDKKVDNIKIPLLSKKGAEELKNKFEKIMQDFIFEINLNSVSPIITKENFSKKKNSYMRQINKFEKAGFIFKKVGKFDEKVKTLHNLRWGENRSDEFFKYLEYMNIKGLSESWGLFLKDEIIAYIQIILTGDTAHYYYSIFNDKYEGAGSAIILYAIKNFIENNDLKLFSFGRGSEVYKHRWNTDIIKNYELRGFLK
ncbi:MAG: GNAT family N-acetyltransferase [Nanobdellota archaeon]